MRWTNVMSVPTKVPTLLEALMEEAILHLDATLARIRALLFPAVSDSRKLTCSIEVVRFPSKRMMGLNC